MKYFNTFLFTLILHTCLFSQNIWTYTGPNGGIWEDPSNWDIGTVPFDILVNDTVFILDSKFISISEFTVVNNSGVIQLNGTLENYGEINNSGEIRIDGGEVDDFGYLLNYDNLNNDGLIAGLGSVYNYDTLTNDNLILLHYLENNSTLNNNATITVQLIVDPIAISYGALLNSGVLTNHIGSTMNIGDNYLYNDSTIIHNSTLTTASNGEVDNFGTISGIGTIEQGNIFSNYSTASFEPGDSTGSMTITGDMDFGEAVYNAEIDGLTMTNDFIDVSGDIVLTNSSLDVTWLTTPISSGTFNIISHISRTGEFANINIPTIPGFTASINYAANAVQLILECTSCNSNWIYVGLDGGDWADPSNWDIGTAPMNIPEGLEVLIPPNKIVSISDTTIVINEGSIQLYGTINNHGVIQNEDDFFISGGEDLSDGYLNNFGTFDNNNFLHGIGFIINNGILNNYNHISSHHLINYSDLHNYNLIEIVINVAVTVMQGELINYGTLINHTGSYLHFMS